jgi:hypothetical protein
VGLSSHCIIKPEPGLILAITNVQVLPFVNQISEGFPTDNPKGYYEALPSVADFINDVEEVTGRSENQLRIIQDGSIINNYALRSNIKYTPQTVDNGLGVDQYTYARTMEIVQQEFDCLFYARKQIQFSFVGIGANDESIEPLVDIFNNCFNSDLLPTTGMNGTVEDVNNLIILASGPPINNYFPYTQSLTNNIPPSVGATTQNDYLIYPYSTLGNGGPVYTGQGTGYGMAAVLRNLPLLNVEFVTFNAGNDTSQGFFSPKILEALGWN